MPSAIEWDNALAHDWRHCYPLVHDAAKRYLDAEGINPDNGLSMTELVERLYPEKLARGDMILRRQKMFKALRAAYENGFMPGYVHPGPAKRYRGTNTNPPMWHAYDADAAARTTVKGEVCCPACGCRFVPEKNDAPEGKAG